MKLLQMYGSSFYGSCLWDLYSPATKQLYICWNIAIRKLYKLPYRTHTRLLEPISGIKHMKYFLKLRYIKYIQSLSESKNTILHNIFNICTMNHLSPSGLMLSRILNEYDMYHLSSCLPHLHSLHHEFTSNYVAKNELTEQEFSYVDIIKEMINCKEGLHVCCLTNEEIDQIILDLCEN